MTRREYTEPPVQEVILDVQFSEALSDQQLQKLRESLGTQWGNADRAEVVQVAAQLRGGHPELQSSSSFQGWDYGREDPNWLLRAYRQQMSLHLNRATDERPRKDYLGWTAIAEKFREVHRELTATYGDLRPRRVALRYLNRILAPTESGPQERVTFLPAAPPQLEGVWGFASGVTWRTVLDHPEFSATIRLAKVEVPEDQRENCFGMLLDIEVFNLWVENAPGYANLPQWFEEAHEVENELFESCITDKSRQEFDQ